MNYFITIISQLLSYIVPFFIIVYISHIYPKELVILLFFSQSLIQNFISITDYGYAIKGSRLFATENNKEKLSKIAGNIYSAKISLLMFSFIILLGIFVISEFAKENFLFIIAHMGVLIANVIFPGWAFLGKKRFHLIYFNTIVSYASLLFLTLLVVRNTTPFIIIAIIYSLSFLLPACIGFIILKKELDFKISFKFKIIYKELIDGFQLFLSTGSKGIYISFPMTALGIISNQNLLYNLSYPDKLVRLFISFFNFLMRLNLPFFIEKNQKVKKYSKLLLLFSPSIPIFLILLKKTILLIIFNIDTIDTTYELLVISLFIKFLYIYLMYSFFFPYKKESFLWKIYTVAILILSISIFICSKLNISAGYSILLSDILILILMLTFIRNSKMNIKVK